MGSKVAALFMLYMILVTTFFPPIHACGYCSHPPPHGKKHPKPSTPPSTKPPIIVPPIIISPPVIAPPVINPPVTKPPPAYQYPPYTGSPPSGGLTPPSGGFPGFNPPPATSPNCPIDSLKLGLCLDVLGGLVHVGLGDPVENTCCPVIQGLLELEAAVCLCLAIRIKLLNINIFIPLALQVLITCGKTPPPGFVCPPL